ncbi:golgin subfamily A member 1-like [Triplophysa dalaica]|uniref:golgin subfamily A member 1-like n=1 Tax=Triplophysa dalaica TaxID=1582913 RepID=UPI0024DF3E21|nr:golgin subfamily A member 1-like [Triplophysa dalaica]
MPSEILSSTELAFQGLQRTAGIGLQPSTSRASDGSSSRDDFSSQIQRRNDHIRKLEAKLSDYAEQLRLMQKTKEKLEIALDKY